jgi:hypothetical protein
LTPTAVSNRTGGPRSRHRPGRRTKS